MTYELKSCPFCAKPLTVRNGVNPYGRCDTEGCWMAEAKIGISCDDPKQVERWNTRPAPAASDTGLETAELRQEIFKLAKDLFWRADGNQRLWSGEEREVYGLQAAMQIARSQAEELLAAKEAERAEQWRLRREMEADRDTQKAIATSLETELAAERAKTERWHKKAMDAGVIVHSDGTTSHPMRKERDDLKAKLSAAQKALDVIFNNPRSETAILEARAVLGRKQ